MNQVQEVMTIHYEQCNEKHSHIRTSWNILHENLERVILHKCPVVSDDVLVYEVAMESDFFLSGLKLPATFTL